MIEAVQIGTEHLRVTVQGLVEVSQQVNRSGSAPVSTQMLLILRARALVSNAADA